jgi:predicted nucleic acid-binding protein
MLFDTDVLIWVFRGHSKAARFVDADDERTVSIVTYMELLQGARDQEETRAIKRFLAEMGFGMLPLTEDIGHRASIYMEEYALKVALTMGDALIAATAVEHDLTLCTGNQKHYRHIQELRLKRFRP